MNKHLIRHRFNRKATQYEPEDSIEEEIARRLLEHLDPVRIEPEKVLDLGAGTGTTQRALAKRYPDARVTAVDFAVAMLERARRDAGGSARLQFVCADMEALGIRGQCFNLVHSNLALLWCANLESVLSECRRVLEPGGLLALSSLGPDTLSELRNAWRIADEHAHVQQFVDMHDLGDALHTAGFTDIVVDAERLRIEYRELDRLLIDLRNWGVGQVHGERRRTLLGRKRLDRMRNEYETYRGENGKLPATCEIAYAHAWAPATPGAAVPRVDFNPLRRRR